MIFDGDELARAWLSVAIASGKDKHPALNRTVLIEQHDDGLQLVSTDSYMLLRAWVPRKGSEGAEPPAIDDVPEGAAVAIDADGRARSLLAHVLQLCARADDDDLPHPDVRVRLGVTDRTGSARQLDGLETSWVIVEVPDVEQVKLPTYDGPYPQWRNVVGAFRSETTDVIALSPAIVAKVAKLDRFHAPCVLGWEFGGADRIARLTVLGSEPHVSGVVMPARWDLDRNTPRTDPEDDDGGDQDELDEDQAA